MRIKFEQEFLANMLTNMFMSINDVWYVTSFNHLNISNDTLTIQFDLSLRESIYFEPTGSYTVTFDCSNDNYLIETHDEIIESLITNNRNLNDSHILTDGNIVIVIQTKALYDVTLYLNDY